MTAQLVVTTRRRLAEGLEMVTVRAVPVRARSRFVPAAPSPVGVAAATTHETQPSEGTTPRHTHTTGRLVDTPLLKKGGCVFRRVAKRNFQLGSACQTPTSLGPSSTV